MDEEMKNTEGNVIVERKSNKLIPIILGIVGGIIVLVISILAVINLLSPKGRYLMLWNKEINIAEKRVEEILKSPIGKFFEFNENDKLKTDIKLVYDIKTEDAEILAFMNNFRKLQLIMTDYIDFKKDYDSSEIKLDLNDAGLINLELVSDSEDISAFSEGMTDKYITANKDNLTDIWEKIGISGPDKILTQKDILKNANFSDSQIKTLKAALKRIGKRVVDLMEDKDFSKPADDKITYDGNTVECQSMILTVPAEKVDKITIEIMKQIALEKDALKIVLDTMNAMNSVYSSLGYKMENLTVEDAIKGIDETIKYIEENPSENAEGIKIITYYKNGRVLRAEVTTDKYNKELFFFTMIDNKNNKYIEYANGMEKQIDKVTINGDIETHNIKIDYLDFGTWEYVENEFSKLCVMTIDKSDKDAVKIGYKNETDKSEIQFGISIKGDKKSLSLHNKTNDGYVASTLNLQYDIENLKEIAEKSIDLNKVFNASKATTEEVKAEYEKIKTNLTGFGAQKETELKQFFSVFSIFMYSIMPSDYYGADTYDDTDFADFEDAQG